jgi:LysR family transcriptional regulator, glycine cleavage system transcriptional activator
MPSTMTIMRSLNLNWIRSFEAAARRLSFTEAAEELGMTQAGVSQHIRLLEKELREPLFLRLPRALRLTDAGAAYHHVVLESFSRLRLGTTEIFGSNSHGLVTLRANMGFIAYWLAPRLGAFLDAHPTIQLRIAAAVHGMDTVWEGIDMEVRYDSDRKPGLDAVCLMSDAFFPVCHPRIAARLAAPADLLRERLLHVIGNRHGWPEWFGLVGIAAAALTGLQSDTSATALALAEQGVGVALGHASLVQGLIAEGRLVRPFAPALQSQGVFYLIEPSGRPISPQARILRAWLLRESTTTGCL